jgi:ribonucleotide monophosphatase NagD (HAD superfamily)
MLTSTSVSPFRRAAVKGERLSASSPAPASGPRDLIAAHAGLRFQDEDSALSLGPGPFVQALSAASGVEPEIIGKPTRGFLEMALRTMESDGIREQDWCEVAIVGDDVKNDLSGGATELGLRRFLGTSTFDLQAGRVRATD